MPVATINVDAVNVGSNGCSDPAGFPISNVQFNALNPDNKSVNTIGLHGAGFRMSYGITDPGFGVIPNGATITSVHVRTRNIFAGSLNDPMGNVNTCFGGVFTGGTCTAQVMINLVPRGVQFGNNGFFGVETDLQTFNTDPATGLPWVRADIFNASWGFGLITQTLATDQLRIFQFYLQIVYTDPTGVMFFLEDPSGSESSAAITGGITMSGIYGGYLSKDVSGIYTLVANQRFDREYVRAGSTLTQDVQIPNPYAELGFVECDDE